MPELVIIGGGPAGLSAAIYAVRAGLAAHVLYKDDGALGKTDKIENYFGFPDVISGAELLSRGRAQAERLGAQLHRTEVTGIREFEGRGVSYCAVCDAFFYRGKAAAVLGQGEYALEEARVLLAVAESVTLLTNGQDAPAPLPAGLSVDTRRISSIEGGEAVERVVFADGEALALDGVFVALGTAGSTDFARKLGAPLDGTHIKSAADGSTMVPGLFAAGDCTGGLLQVAKAVSDGAAAAMSAIKFLRK